MSTKQDLKYLLAGFFKIILSRTPTFLSWEFPPDHGTIFSTLTLSGSCFCLLYTALQYIHFYFQEYFSRLIDFVLWLFTQWKAHENAKDEGLEPSSKEHEGTQSAILSEPQASSAASEHSGTTENEEPVEPAQPDIIIIDWSYFNYIIR